jgi:PAS domain S-box-containing protein
LATPKDRFTAEQLDAVTELIPVGIIRMDPSGNCLHVNARWSLLTGLSAEAARGEGWKRGVAPEDRERVVREICEAGADAGEFAEEFHLRTPDGRGRAVSSRVLPLRAADGGVAGYVATVADLTERYQTEDALRDLAREHTDRIKELKCLIDIFHIIEGSGESLPDIMQRTVDLLASSWGHPEITCARIVLDGRHYQTANYRQAPWRQTADIAVDGRPAGVLEVGYLQEKPDADQGPFLAEEQRVLDAVAEQLGRTAERLNSQRVLRDRERGLREREQELRERLTHLTRVNMMGEMAASIAHEVNQPLAAIAAYAQGCRRLLEAGAPADPSLVEAVTQIANEALRAGDIVHRLDDLARKHRGQRVRCDINALIRDVHPLATVDARLHDLRLLLELDGSLPPIHADGVQLQQVLLNLIRNAIDAMDDTEAPERKVIVRTGLREDGNIEVTVTDHGCGLDEGSEARVFEPFFTTKETGIGMGLAISRSIVTAHGGRLWFTRNPDRGTTFSFTIPVAVRSQG